MMNEIRLLRTLIQILITGHISIALRGLAPLGEIIVSLLCESLVREGRVLRLVALAGDLPISVPSLVCLPGRYHRPTQRNRSLSR